MSGTLSFSVLVLLLSWCLYRVLKIGSRERGLPPGPPTIPILGNALMIPRIHLHQKLTEIAKQYGKIFSLKFANKTMVVLSDPVLIRELLDHRSATTSDRPDMYVADLITSGLNTPLMHYGPTWKDYRRVLREFLSREATMEHLPIQRAESAQLMYDLMKDPTEFKKHIERYTTSVVLSTCFGLRCPRHEDSYVSAFYSVERDFETLISPGGAPPVDLFPILKYVPERWAKWKTKAKEVKKRQGGLYMSLVELCRRRIREERRTGCFVEKVLEDQEKYRMSEEMMVYLAGTLIEAGSDTAATFLRTFILLMITHPEVQKQAQEELDRVVGQSRSPMLEDYDSLPYLKAVIKEVHRLRPVLPLLIPHSNITIEIIENYIIPKGSFIVANIWGLNRDPESFKDSDKFNPDRFSKSEFGTRSGTDDTARRHDINFGCGRRVCPGMYFVTNSIMLNTMNLLWAFNFNLAKDSNTGEPIPIDLNLNAEAILLSPEPVKCDIQPRSEHHTEVIKAEYEAARDVFSVFEHELNEEERRYVKEW